MRVVDNFGCLNLAEHHLVFYSVNAPRYEGGNERVFDWRLGIMRDHGILFRSDTTLFVKHPSIGAMGPRVQVLNYDLDARRNTQVNYGFTFTTRPGFQPRYDILFVSLLLSAGGTINGTPARDVYGMHLFKAPVNFELATDRYSNSTVQPTPAQTVE